MVIADIAMASMICNNAQDSVVSAAGRNETRQVESKGWVYSRVLVFEECALASPALFLLFFLPLLADNCWEIDGRSGPFSVLLEVAAELRPCSSLCTDHVEIDVERPSTTSYPASSRGPGYCLSGGGGSFLNN